MIRYLTNPLVLFLAFMLLMGVIALPLVLQFKHVGIALMSLTTEIFVTAVMFAALRKHGLNVSGRPGPVVDNRGTVA